MSGYCVQELQAAFQKVAVVAIQRFGVFWKRYIDPQDARFYWCEVNFAEVFAENSRYFYEEKPTPWVRYLDPVTQQPWYYNELTAESFWATSGEMHS